MSRLRFHLSGGGYRAAMNAPNKPNPGPEVPNEPDEPGDPEPVPER